jgi:hypothetical protein
VAKLRAGSGKVSRTAVLAWSVLSFAGCSAIAGLDSIQEQACAPNCGDAAVADSRAPVDSSAQSDSAQVDTSTVNDSSMTEDTSPVQDSGTTTVDSGGPQDSGVIDTGTIIDAPPVDDAPFDSGCGDLNSTSNCSACGDKCAPNSSSVTSQACCAGTVCPGSTNGVNNSCQYTCATGYLDCDGPAGTNPPNTNGCECHVPGATASQCCAGGCPVQHVDGLVGQTYYPKSDTFYDCVPAGTMNIQLAADACAAYVTARGGNAATNCGEFGPTDGGPPDSVCAITAGNCGSNCTGYDGDCICWTASGTYKGQVLDPVALGLDDKCYTGQSSLTFN